MIRWVDEALILRRMPYRDTSLILHLFTRQHGVQHAMARGVRSIGRRTGGRLQQAALAGFHTVTLGFQARSETHLGVVTLVEIQHPRHHLLHRATALLAAQVAQETLYRFFAPGEPRADVFELMAWVWDSLDAGKDPLAVAGLCQGRLVRALGYGWRTDCCAGCGAVAQLTYFSVKRGQVVCAHCAAPYAKRLVMLGEALFEVLQTLAWTEPLFRLSEGEKRVLYGIGMASLMRLAGGNGRLHMRSDALFRERAGMT